MGFLKTSLKVFFLIIFLSTLLLSCGSQVQNDPVSQNSPPPQQSTNFKTSGLLMDINQTEFVLSEVSNKPRILIFAGTFCSICQGEHRELQNLFDKNGGSLPSNVEIITIMVDATDNSDALDFKDFTDIKWNPFYQQNQDLRTQLCGAASATPCTIVELPNQGVVYQKIGGTTIQTLQNLTGAWLW